MNSGEQSADCGTGSVSVERVTRSERDLVLSLRPHPHQERFIASNEDSLEEAESNPVCVPLVVRAAGEPVGFAMYALDEDDGNYWIYRLMIDARFQGKGYGSAALIQIIKILSELPHCSCVMLGVNLANERARRVYERAGFQLTGDIIDGENVMRYDF